jgi:hypothetical protein
MSKSKEEMKRFVIRKFEEEHSRELRKAFTTDSPEVYAWLLGLQIRYPHETQPSGCDLPQIRHWLLEQSVGKYAGLFS